MTERFRSSENLRHAGEDMSSTAEWAQVLVGFAGLLLVAGTLYYAHKAWRAAEAANRQAREFFVIERRAWLSVTTSPLTIQNWQLGDTVASVTITVVNLGHSPALNVELHQQAWTFEIDESALTRAAITGRQQRSQRGPMIFPSKPLEMHAQFETSPFSAGIHRLYLHGWVSYRTPGDDAVHLSPFIFQYSFSVNAAGSPTHLAPETPALAICPD